MDSRQRQPRMTSVGRFARGRRPDRNPLRRPSDLIETIMLAVLVVTFLVAAPFAAWQSGAWMHATAHQTQLAEQVARHQVTAVVLNPASGSQLGGWGTTDAWVPARWTAPDGQVITGKVVEPMGTVAGAKVRVWVTRDGQPANEPLLDSQVSGQVLLAQMLSVIALATLLVVSGALGRQALDKRRMASWDAAWRSTGPRWTARK
jgi:hypothetical protein